MVSKVFNFRYKAPMHVKTKIRQYAFQVVSAQLPWPVQAGQGTMKIGQAFIHKTYLELKKDKIVGRTTTK